MENETVNFNHLLPAQFKYVGFTLAIFALASGFFIELAGFREIYSQSIIPSIFLRNALIIGLFMIAASRERIEDELVGLLRLKALEISFRSAVLFVVIDSFLPLSETALNAISIVFIMLVVYLLVFNAKMRQLQ
jgi:hypothetical protein